ncbi:MAG: hypothetical protein AAGM38_01590 [Pseudomonadota bacterium]
MAKLSKRRSRPLVEIDPPGAGAGKLKSVAGSSSDDWNNVIANQTLNTVWFADADDDEILRLYKASIEGLAGLRPRDELEGMAAAQLIAAHNAAMECYRRAMLQGQTFEGRRENLNQANKLTRSWATLLDALHKHRGKGQQKVTVEHVHVHAGGQAVVGAVESGGAGASGGGRPAQSEDQPHASATDAKKLAHAPQPEMRREDTARDALPLAGDAERPLPHARRKRDRRAEG